MSERVWHYVKENHTVRLPRRHVYLDTESASTRIKGGHRQTWRLGVASFVEHPKGRRRKDTMATFTAPRQLWGAVDSFCRPRSRTVLWAHNLGYDARISEALTVLPRAGWVLEGHNLANRGTWFQWRRNDTSLLMVDSAAVFPCRLDELAPHFGLGKLRMPAADASVEAWARYCARDVQILDAAVSSYLDWLETEELGNWQLTGAGQSYAAYRHRWMTHQMLVHADIEALEAERRAMWTGRCEAYWHGRTGHVGIEEWDQTLSYARIARDHAVPVRLLGRAANPTRLEKWLGNPSLAVLAEVEVDTAVPTLPASHDGRILWPVGRFTTVVWDPELRMALAAGATLRPLRVWLYKKEPALKAWATWIIDRLGQADSVVPPWQRIILKHWARALIGRFGMTYQAWEPYGTTDDPMLRQGPVYDTRTGQTTAMSQVGGTVLMSAGTQEWDQSQPAVTGYVTSVARVQLWRILQALPPRTALYADTDSVLVRRRDHDALAELAATDLGEGLRLKNIYRGARILGPRQLILDDKVRVAGVPTRAKRLPSGDIEGEVWASLAGSLRRGEPTSVTTLDRRWQVRGVDRRRQPGPDGWTLPVHIEGGQQ